MTTLPTLSDLDFLNQFEDHSLNPEYFSHLGHLRLAWLYLTRYDLNTAITKTCDGIKSYAESLGAHDKFHYTMTHAFVMIMHRRIMSQGNNGWHHFLSGNPDLIDDADDLLLRHFRYDTLFNDRARTTLIPPDINPL